LNFDPRKRTKYQTTLKENRMETFLGNLLTRFKLLNIRTKWYKDHQRKIYQFE